MVSLYQLTKAEGRQLRSASLFPEPPYSHVFPQFSFWLLVPTQKHCLKHLPSASPVTPPVHLWQKSSHIYGTFGL